MTLQEYRALRERALAYDPEIIKRSSAIEPPEDATDFALRVAFVILNASLRSNIALRIWSDMSRSLLETGAVGVSFRHPRKVAAIDRVFDDRKSLFETFEFSWRSGEQAVIAFCETIPGIGSVTRYHLAKNLGVDCAKPDIWLQRVADQSRETVHDLCSRLAAESGDRIATVDSVIWRCCERGWLCAVGAQSRRR